MYQHEQYQRTAAREPYRLKSGARVAIPLSTGCGRPGLATSDSEGSLSDGRTLSQDEIEALIASIGGDEAAAEAADENPAGTDSRAIKSYDFRFPDKFSKEHMRTFQVLYGQFARGLSAALTAHLRTTVQVHVSMVEQMTYEEYMHTLANPTLMYIVSMAPLSGQAVVEMNLLVARTILDRLLGSNGALSPRQMEMTEIELSLIESVGTIIKECLRDGWRNVLDLDLSMQEPVFTPDFVQVTLPGESSIAIIVEISLMSITGTLSMCIPHPMLAPIMDKLNAQAWFAGGGPATSAGNHLDLDRPITGVAMPLSVELGTAQLTVRDLLNLEVGQVIRLDTSANGSLPVRVGNSVKFEGRPGLVGKNLAVEISQPAD